MVYTIPTNTLLCLKIDWLYNDVSPIISIGKRAAL